MLSLSAMFSTTASLAQTPSFSLPAVSRGDRCFAAMVLSLGPVISMVLAFSAQAAEDSQAIETVVIEAKQRAVNSELGLSVVELSDDELVAKMGATLGETLANEPGVHNASYGPGVGLPVLRGLSGVRVRLSEDGIGAWDASSISPDHATAIEPVLAEKIQVVKGAATVIHGNNAVGGTVEVTHGRIAEVLEGQAVSTVFEARRELENDHDRESYVGKLRKEIGKFVFQVDGFTRRSGDMSIPGVALEEQAINDVFGIANSDNTFGTVLNTDADAYSRSFALSYVGDDFFVGGSSTLIDSNYGLPPGAHTEPPDSPGHSHSHPVGDNIVAQARVRIDLEQDRHLLKLGGAIADAKIDAFRFTLGKIEYEHNESELDPLTDLPLSGTLFHNEVLEAKAEFDHSLFDFINDQHHGRFGLQWIDRSFIAESVSLFGGEDYIPPTDQQAIGVFMYDQLPLQRGSLELGTRYEWQRVTQRELTAPLLPDNLQFFHEPITYQAYTLSAALSHDLTEAHRFVFNINSAQRAPEIQELLSLGPHLATRSYDIGLLLAQRQAGDDLPKPEVLSSGELRWEWQGRIGEMNSALFYTDAKDFIYQERQALDGLFDTATQQFSPDCTRLEQCIAVFRYTQNDVTFAGYEWQWLLPAIGLQNSEFQVELFGDYVRGKIAVGGDVPRMPPRRNGIGVTWTNNSINAGLRYTYVSAQNKAGDNESTTAAYDLLNANFSYTYRFEDSDDHNLMVFLQMKNLLDEDIRKSTSFLRNFTPEPGREISLGIRHQF